MSINKQFNGLDIKNLIGVPLDAVIDANKEMAETTGKFIEKVGFDSKGKVREANFDYIQNEDGQLLEK
ncbi:MAG: DUF2589 domain-containing protein [Coprobacillus sp.]